MSTTSNKQKQRTRGRETNSFPTVPHISNLFLFSNTATCLGEEAGKTWWWRWIEDRGIELRVGEDGNDDEDRQLCVDVDERNDTKDERRRTQIESKQKQ